MTQPYPAKLVTRVVLADGATVTIRPIRPADAQIEQEFVRNLSGETRYFRFMDTLKELSPRMLQQLTDIDYDRHMALIAVTTEGASETEIAVARYVVGQDSLSCEFAIVVADAWQRRGVGAALMRALMDAARSGGLVHMHGEVLASNHGMLHFMRRCGFRIARDTGDPHAMRVEADL